jgi:predicted transcriptional regulator
MGKKRSLHGLGSLQTEAMEIVWDLGEATVADVHERVSRRRTITYTTALVAMQKLEKSGWLVHRRDGRANVYRAKRNREAAGASVLRDVLKQAFGGDPRLLLSHLIDQEAMSEEELADLRRLINSRIKEHHRE